MRSTSFAVVFLTGVFLSVPALAGDRPYAFVQGSDAVAPDSLEIENWFGETRPVHGRSSYEWWIGPVTGASDHLELGLFAVLGQTVLGSGASPSFALDSLRLQATWRLADPGKWPVDVRLRGEINAPMGGERDPTVWIDAIASKRAGPLDVTANANLFEEFKRENGRQKYETYLDGGLGASLAAGKGLRVGGEFFAQENTSNHHEHFRYAGPSIAYGHGRFWTAATWGFGFDRESGTNRARLIVGISL